MSQERAVGKGERAMWINAARRRLCAAPEVSVFGRDRRGVKRHAGRSPHDQTELLRGQQVVGVERGCFGKAELIKG
jgi:hypothetical protein